MHGGINGGRFDDGAFGAQIPDRKHDGTRQPAILGDLGRHDYVIRIDSIALLEQIAERLPPRAHVPRVQNLVPRLADYGQALAMDDAQLAEMPHDFGDAAGQVQLDRRVIHRTVRQDVDKSRNAAIGFLPIRDGRTFETGGMGDGGNVQQKIGRAAAGRMHGDGIVDRRLREDVAERQSLGGKFHQGCGRVAGHVEPDRLAARCQRGVRHGEPHRFCDHLAGRGGSQELTTSAGTATRAATCGRGVFQGKLPIHIPGADCLYFGRVFGPTAGNVTPPGTMMPGRSRQPARASIAAGSPLSQVATASTPCRLGSERIKRRMTIAASLR